MKTYTFKLKVDSDKVVIAVNMQLEQFFDSVKLTKNLKELCDLYPHAYITACDFYTDDGFFVTEDFPISKLKTLLDSKDLKSYLTSSDFIGFYGDEHFDTEYSLALFEDAHEAFLIQNKSCDDSDEEEENANELSEADEE